jgi:transposase-like protein
MKREVTKIKPSGFVVGHKDYTNLPDIKITELFRYMIGLEFTRGSLTFVGKNENMKTHDFDTRWKAIRRWQTGENKSDISRALGVDYNTLLIWIRRFQSEGELGLKPKYSGCGRKLNIVEKVARKPKSIDIPMQTGVAATFV